MKIPFYDELGQGSDDSDGESGEGKGSKKSSEFAQMFEDSVKKPKKKLSPGDKVRGEILVIGKENVFASFNNGSGGSSVSSDGMISRRDLLNPEGQITVKVGDVIDLYVTQIRGTEISLSPKPTSKNLSEDIREAYEMRLPVEGRVSELCKGGVRVLVRGKQAFCPISQLDLSRTETGEEFIGQKLEFLITQYSEGGRNIVVSRRRLLESARTQSAGHFSQDRKEGEVVSGKVKRIEPFGAFVEVAPGVEGLLHISELSWSRVADPQEVVSVGQEVQVKILKIENVEGRLKISLSMKQVGPEPWNELPVQIKEGQMIEGKVTRCMKFGAFVELVPGIEGLIPLSEMSYTKRVMRSDEIIKEGERVHVMIKEVHPETKRISLSLKDAGGDPWALVSYKYPVGTILTGRVERKEPYGLFVQLEEGVVGLLPKSKAHENAEFPFDKLKVGDQATVQISELKTDERRITLTPPQDPNRDDWKGYVSPSGTGSFGTLGDQLKNAMKKK